MASHNTHGGMASRNTHSRMASDNLHGGMASDNTRNGMASLDSQKYTRQQQRPAVLMQTMHSYPPCDSASQAHHALSSRDGSSQARHALSPRPVAMQSGPVDSCHNPELLSRTSWGLMLRTDESSTNDSGAPFIAYAGDDSLSQHSVSQRSESQRSESQRSESRRTEARRCESQRSESQRGASQRSESQRSGTNVMTTLGSLDEESAGANFVFSRHTSVGKDPRSLFGLPASQIGSLEAAVQPTVSPASR